MPANYEFRSQTLRQKLILYGTRLIVVVWLLAVLYRLAFSEYRGFVETVEDVGSVCTLIWVHCNVIQAKVEIQELFVPPFNTLNGLEFMLLGVACYLTATYMRLADILG